MIVCGGENLVDVIEMGDEQQDRVFHAVPGGSPYNCTRALGRLGMPTGYLTPISSDRFGDDLLAGLLADQVRHLGARPDAPTSLAMVTLSDGQPDYRFYRNGTAERMVTPEVLRATMPEQAEAFHIGSLALCTGKDAAAWSDLFIDCARRGIFTSLTPTSARFWPKRMRAAIAPASTRWPQWPICCASATKTLPGGAPTRQFWTRLQNWWPLRPMRWWCLPKGQNRYCATGPAARSRCP